MKHNQIIQTLVVTIAILTSGIVAQAQTQTENHIYTTTYQVETQDGSVPSQDKIENINYYDGLGRPKQSVAKRQTPNQKDIVTHMEYDEYGRMTREYLPVPTNSNSGTFLSNAASLTDSYYQNNYPADINSNSPNPYSEKLLEDSPLSRVFKQAAPGEDWRLGGGHEIEFTYETNEFEEVRLYKVEFTDPNDTEVPSLSVNGFYLPAQLYKTVTYDENHTFGRDHSTEEFMDKQGRVILKRTYNNNVAYDTHYVYDDFGNLTYVLTPKVTTNNGISQVELNGLCYQYRYDHRNRLVEKKIPGKDWEYIVYNKLDQPVMTQDANLRANNRWLFTKYDPFARVAYTGIVSLSGTRESIQSTANATTNQFEQKTTSHTTIDGSKIYYSNNTFPSTGFQRILSISYYDDYDIGGSFYEPDTSNFFGEPIERDSRGNQTVMIEKGIERGFSIITVMGYDKKGRVIQTITKNTDLVIAEKVDMDLREMTGQVLAMRTEHVRGKCIFPYYGSVDSLDDVTESRPQDPLTNDPEGTIQTIVDYATNFAPGDDHGICPTPVVIIERFKYDHLGRLITQTHKINNQDEQFVTRNSYDAIGQREYALIGESAIDGVSPIQNVFFDYNIRGWLTKINEDLENLGNDMFAFEITYNDVAEVSNVSKPLYNGNISEIKWIDGMINAANNPISKSYKFLYDPMNRLTKATDNTTRYSLENVSYDKNGNIESLRRKGHLNEQATTFGLMDNLNYFYNGNKLTSVTDASGSEFGFKDGVVSEIDYQYDNNGNMINDSNKGLDNISYNHLNLPNHIDVSNEEEGEIAYFYTASGMKYRQVVKNDNGDSKVTDYFGSFVYEDGVVKMISHSEGYLEPDGTGAYDYVYQYKDHLGNIRLSYKEIIDSRGVNEDGTGYGIGSYDQEGEEPLPEDLFEDVSENVTRTFDNNGVLILDIPQGESVRQIFDTADTTAHSLFLSIGLNTGYYHLLFVYEETQDGFVEIQEASGISLTESGDVFVDFQTTSERVMVVIETVDNIEDDVTENLSEIRIGRMFLSGFNREVVEAINYYPFGLQHKGYNNVVSPNSNSVANKFRFNGKEINEELGLDWYDFGARNYDASLGRWFNIDPLAENYSKFSPYNYTLNNPILYTDPDGMRVDFGQLFRDTGDEEKNRENLFTALNTLVDLSNITGLNLSLNASGDGEHLLEYNGTYNDESGNPIGSEAARFDLKNAIDDQSFTAKVGISDNGRSKGSGLSIDLSVSEIERSIDGSTNVDDRTSGYGFTFLHELNHTLLGNKSFVVDGLNRASENQVIKRTNLYRSQLNDRGENFGQRFGHSFDLGPDGRYYNAFSKSAYNRILDGQIPTALDEQFIVVDKPKNKK